MFIEGSPFSTTTLGYDSPDWGPIVVPLHPGTMDKLAGSSYTPQRILDFIQNVRPRDDGRYILLNALGAGEYWGANRNGDYFNEWSLLGDPPPTEVMELIRAKSLPVPAEYGYKTFEKYAYPYRHHNNSDPQFSCGERVCCAAYNDKMHRVELIVFIYEHKAPDIVRALDDGKPIAFSMGAKLLWDLCSVCFNAARNRGEYCEHLKNSLGKTFEDGRRVFAYNYFPRFFDISEIMVPADRSAYSLKKVAGVMSGPLDILEVPQALHLPAGMEKYAGLLDFLSTGGKTATIEKDVPAQEPAKNLGPSPIDPGLWKILNQLVTQDEGFREDIPPCALAGLRGSPMNSILSSLTSLGILLGPSEVGALTGGDENKIPGSLDLSNPDPTLLSKLREFVPGRSMFDPHFSVRMLRVIREKPGSAKRVTATGDTKSFEKYRDLLKNKLDVKQLKEATTHPQVQALLNPGSLERNLLELEGEDHPFHKMILPFLAAAGLTE